MLVVYISKGGINLGGFDLDGIHEGLKTGYFTADDFARLEGMTEWKPLQEILQSVERAASQNKAQPTITAEDRSRTYVLKPRLRKDEHGQPKRLFKANLENNISKAIDQLSGICTGILADGVVTDQEAAFFRDWVRSHAEMEPVWPLTDILQRVEHVFAHGKIADDERSELADIMRSICGGDELKSDTVNSYASALPLDDPAPDILFKDNEFVVTGRFAYGTRTKVMECINSRLGIAKDGFPSSITRYLVIGTFASRDWYNTNYGRKIERAIQLRSSHRSISIVSEEHWKAYLQ